MEKEAMELLAKALDLVQDAQMHLIKNVNPSEDPKEVKRHFRAAWELLLDASDVLEPLAYVPPTSLSPQPPETAA